MTINAPVQALIINPSDVQDFVLNQHYSWVWGERESTENPTHEEIWRKAATSFSDNPETVVFMVAVTTNNNKFIDFIEGRVTGVEYESGLTGMLNVVINSSDNRWTKIHGFYNCRLGSNPSGCLSLTQRR